MQNRYNTAQSRSFRRWVRQCFFSRTDRRDCNYLKEILEKLQDIEDLIDIIAREIARQAKRGE